MDASRLILGGIGGLCLLPLLAVAQEPCPEGTLLEPFAQVCASINDRRAWWLTPAPQAEKVTLSLSDLPNLDELRGGGSPATERHKKSHADEMPEPGHINAGTVYRAGALTANTSGRLHTKMFVHPQGLNPSGFLGWTFTPATNRVDSAVEVVGIYRTALGDNGVLSIFGRPCSTEYPCPDGDTSNGWQPSKDFSELTCNITQIVDEGGHGQKLLHYANHSDRLDDADPPLWKNAVYLWNYCAGEWDLIWQHTYRENKRDCSVVGCFFWGPAFELPGDPFPRPQINELGYEDTLLFHDGTWSDLGPDETDFRDPEDRPDLTPWQLFHLKPNGGFGAGNFVNDNDAPVIVGQVNLATPEDTALQISVDDLMIQDPDVDPAYHVAFALTVFAGTGYTVDGSDIIPDEDYHGQLSIGVAVNDGALDSATFDLLVEVLPVNDAPTVDAPIADQSFTAGAVVVLDVSTAFDDPDLDTLQLSAVGLPTSLTLNAQGVIEGTVTDQDVLDSPFAVTVTATDPEGLQASDVFELAVTFVDTDGDQIPDVWELQFGQDPLDPADAGLDPDDDGLTTLAEFNAGTDPTQHDTDNDGLGDGFEVEHHLDPTDGVCPSWICIDSRRGWRLRLLRPDAE